MPTRRLAGVCAGVVAVAGGGTAIALAGGSGPVPPSKPLAVAVHDGLTAPETQGITARVKFTNHLIDTSGIEGANPLLNGATGRLWLSPERGFRLELQSGNGDAQVVANKAGFWAYDGTSNTVYRGHAPPGHDRRENARNHRVPSIARIQRGLDRARNHKLDISGPVPGNIAGQPAYTVRVAPGRPGGLLGAVELAWDAARGLPLRVAVYARGNNDPVLELTATEVQYGPVADSTFAISPPADAHVVNLFGGARKPGKQRSMKRLPFRVVAPDTLAGRQRARVRVLHGRAALVRYGRDLDSIFVIEKAAKPEAQTPTQTRGDRHRLQLPTVDINGATAKVLDTPLGSIVTFERGGVSYTVLGSVHASVAEAAARGL
jgi:outer membrane lipoprotein-sorting protein